MSSDIVRLPNGKTVTRGRALAAGWIDAEGNLTDKVPASYAEQAKQVKAERVANWRRQQGLDEPPEAIAALQGKRVKQPKPLKPANVKDGEVITDKALLDEIAAKTEAIEAAEKAARS